jgi:hypothetical protein
MTFPVRVAATIVRAWTRAYTWGMPSMWAEQRRSEIESDLWELRTDPDPARGLSPAIQILARLVAGIGDDVSWRLERTTFDDNVFLRKAVTIVALATVVLALLWASPGANGSPVACVYDRTPGTPRVAQVVECVGALLGSQRSQPVDGGSAARRFRISAP